MTDQYGTLESDRPATYAQYSKKSDVDILADARDHKALVELMESKIRDESSLCLKFRALEQWKESVVTQRGDRPTLVVDQVSQYVDQVVNDWRRNRLGIKINPGDGPADPEHAKVLEGWVRQVEYTSKAHLAYDWAAECMIGNNRGFLKILTKRRKGSFKQDPWFYRIPNADCVYMDPFCEESDYSDQRRTLIIDKLSLKAFQAKYPHASIQSFEGYLNDKSYADWIQADSVTVGEWWVAEEKPRKIQLLTKPIAVIRNGKALKTDTVYDNEYEKLPEGIEIARNPDGELMEDDEPERIIWQFLLSGVEIIHRTRWPGSIIPVVPFLGKELYVDGKKRLYSVISRALDSQRLLNYAKSSLAERMGQFPKNPVMALNGQISSDVDAWKNMNTVPHAFVVYDPVLLPDGTYHTEPPHRADFDPRLDQFAIAIQQGKEDIKGSIGMYGASLGDHEGKARSGAAERALQQEGDNATFDFLDNGGRGVELAGKILVDLFPKLVPAADIIQIRDAQDKVLSIAVNQPIAAMKNAPVGQTQDFDFTEGAYHVSISAAPSHETLRAEGAEMSLEVVKMLPPEEAVKAVPVMLRLQPWFGASEIADVLDPPREEGMESPQVLAKMQQAQQVIDTQAEIVKKLMDEKESKILELQSRERMNAADNRTRLIAAQYTLIAAEMKAGSTENLAMLQIEAEKEKAALDAQIASESSMQEHAQGEVAADNQVEREPEPTAAGEPA